MYLSIQTRGTKEDEAALAIIDVLKSMYTFVIVDIGRPDRIWHMIPLIGRFNFPASLLAWDVVVLSGDLFHKSALDPPPLLQAVNRLEKLNQVEIPVVAVTGNHDGGALPRLADAMAALNRLRGIRMR